MNLVSAMKATSTPSRSFDFCFPSLDTHVRVEEEGGVVVIRASRNTFTPRRKNCFIRELAAEGFIADHHQWSSVATGESFLGVRWLVDKSWLKLDPAIRASADRFMVRSLVGAALLWVLLVGGAVFLR